MNRNPYRTRFPLRLPRTRAFLALIIALSMLLSGCALVSEVLGGKPLVPDGATTADLRGVVLDEEAFAELLTCTQLSQLDLRETPETAGRTVTIKLYEQLHAALPDCEILWSVPFGDVAFDSTLAEITLPEVDAGAIQAVRYFPNLTRVDASACNCYDALLALAESMPQCTFIWNVSLGGKTVSNQDSTLDLSGTDVTAEQLGAALPYLPKLTGVDLHDTGLSGEKLAALAHSHPNIRFDANLDVCGVSVDTGASTLDLTDTTAFDAQSLLSALPYFTNAESVDLTGLSISSSDMDALQAAYPEIRFLWDIELCGTTVTGSDTELDLSGKTIESAEDFAAKLKHLPNLTKINLCDCNLTDEELGKLSEQFPNIKFIWYVTIGRWQVRTDAEAFSTGNERSTDSVRYLKSGTTNLTTEDIQPLKYCTDLVALDIGHKRRIKDISILTHLPKLRFLIIAMEGFTDLSPIASCTELEYLETFQNFISDISPLLALKKLTHLNCSTNAIGSIDVLKQMTQLQWLWCIRCGLDNAQLSELQTALPDCTINATGTHSTSNGWRKNDLYREMQKLFGLAALE